MPFYNPDSLIPRIFKPKTKKFHVAILSNLVKFLFESDYPMHENCMSSNEG